MLCYQDVMPRHDEAVTKSAAERVDSAIAPGLLGWTLHVCICTKLSWYPHQVEASATTEE